MKTTLKTTISLALLGASVAWGGTLKAKMGEVWCDQGVPKNTFGHGSSMGYMIGWKDATENPSVVFEDGVTNEQMAKVFMVYMQNHPEEENKPLSDVLMRAMENAGLVKVGGQ